MLYKLAVASRIETDRKNQLLVVTFYPSLTLCIKPRPYERLVASCVCEVSAEFAEGISEKGKSRLKLVLRDPNFDEDERRQLGAAYYAALFGRPCGNDETRKGVADSLYQTMCELYAADASTEEAWLGAVTEAIETVKRAVLRHPAE